MLFQFSKVKSNEKMIDVCQSSQHQCFVSRMFCSMLSVQGHASDNCKESEWIFSSFKFLKSATRRNMTAANFKALPMAWTLKILSMFSSSQSCFASGFFHILATKKETKTSLLFLFHAPWACVFCVDNCIDFWWNISWFAALIVESCQINIFGKNCKIAFLKMSSQEQVIFCQNLMQSHWLNLSSIGVCFECKLCWMTDDFI